MKPTLTALLVACTLTLGSAVAQAADSKARGKGASTVADMMQKKNDAKLRTQLVSEGRWTEIATLDEATAVRAQAQQDNRYVHANEQLVQRNGVDAPIDARALDCDPDAIHVR
jgi:hypothetical protein